MHTNAYKPRMWMLKVLSSHTCNNVVGPDGWLVFFPFLHCVFLYWLFPTVHNHNCNNVVCLEGWLGFEKNIFEPLMGGNNTSSRFAIIPHFQKNPPKFVQLWDFHMFAWKPLRGWLEYEGMYDQTGKVIEDIGYFVLLSLLQDVTYSNYFKLCSFKKLSKTLCR